MDTSTLLVAETKKLQRLLLEAATNGVVTKDGRDVTAAEVAKLRLLVGQVRAALRPLQP